MIWTLWIINLLGADGPEWTVHSIHETDMACWQAWYEVTSEFDQMLDKVAFCGLTV